MLEQLRAGQATATAPEVAPLDGHIQALRAALAAETVHREELYTVSLR